MEISRQFQACLLFFSRKYFASTKTHHKRKSANKTNKLTLNNKDNNFLRAHKLLWRDVFLCARNLFVKKINRLEIVLIAPSHITTENQFNSTF